MAAPYSVDLRWKIVQACQRGTESQRQVADFFNVSLAFVEKLMRLYRDSGDVISHRVRRRLGPPARVDAAGRQRIVQWLSEQPDLTLAELTERLESATGVKVGKSTMGRVVQQLDLRLKKRRSMPPSGIRLGSSGHVGITGGEFADACSRS